MRKTIHTWTLGLSAAACLLTACAPDTDPEVSDTYVPPVLLPDAGNTAPVNPQPDAAQAFDSGTPTAEAGVLPSDAGSAGDASPSDAMVPAAETLLPFFSGATWTYRVTSATGTTMKITTVGPEEAVGGTGPNASKRAFKVTTTKGASDKTVSWQAVVGDSVIRLGALCIGTKTSGELDIEAGRLGACGRCWPADLQLRGELGACQRTAC